MIPLHAALSIRTRWCAHIISSVPSYTNFIMDEKSIVPFLLLWVTTNLTQLGISKVRNTLCQSPMCLLISAYQHPIALTKYVRIKTCDFLLKWTMVSEASLGCTCTFIHVSSLCHNLFKIYNGGGWELKDCWSLCSDRMMTSSSIYCISNPPKAPSATIWRIISNLTIGLNVWS